MRTACPGRAGKFQGVQGWLETVLKPARRTLVTGRLIPGAPRIMPRMRLAGFDRLEDAAEPNRSSPKSSEARIANDFEFLPAAGAKEMTPNHLNSFRRTLLLNSLEFGLPAFPPPPGQGRRHLGGSRTGRPAFAALENPDVAMIMNVVPAHGGTNSTVSEFAR